MPETFYLSGGAFHSAGEPLIGAAAAGDERAEFLAYCIAMDATKSTKDRPCKEEVVHCSETLPSTPPIFPPRPLRPRSPNIDGKSKPLIAGNDVCKQEANDGTGLPSHRPQDHKVEREGGGRNVAVNAPGSVPETCQPPVRGTDMDKNGVVAVHSGSGSLKFDSGLLATGAPAGRETEDSTRNQEGSRGSSAEGCGGEARDTCGGETRDNGGGIALGGVAGGTPTWVVKPAANSNCGFGIHICCSLKVASAAARPFLAACASREI